MLLYAFMCFYMLFICFSYAFYTLFVRFLYAFASICFSIPKLKLSWAKKQNVPSSSSSTPPATYTNLRLSRCAAGKKEAKWIAHCGFSVKDHGSISEIFHCHQSDFLHFLDQIWYMNLHKNACSLICHGIWVLFEGVKHWCLSRFISTFM